MYHAAHKGPLPIAFVDTGLYAGGKHDYYVAFDERDLLWTRRMDHVLKSLGGKGAHPGTRLEGKAPTLARPTHHPRRRVSARQE
jgi:hypothetical protein